jgi:hypothetical protein
MPHVVDYPIVLEQLTAAGFVSLYHHSGAFGFAPEAKVQMVGWIGPADGTIRQELLPHICQVDEPYALTLAELARQAWLSHLSGECWLMPKSHWHYELHFGNRAMLEALLPELGIAVTKLKERNDGSAIAFSIDEDELFREAVRWILKELRFSDFLLVFPSRATVCTIHHHQQLWWQTTNAAAADALGTLVD